MNRLASRPLYSADKIEKDVPHARLHATPEVVTLPQSTFAERFTPLRTTLLDPEGVFSGSQMHADLTALIPLAKSRGEQSAELAELYAALALLQGKRDEWEEQRTYGLQALAIQARNPVLPPTTCWRCITACPWALPNWN